jgi:hypothetical protein
VEDVATVYEGSIGDEPIAYQAWKDYLRSLLYEDAPVG